MLRLLSPLLLWVFIKANRYSLKRLLIVVSAYLLVLVVYIDFESVFFENKIAVFKLIKWLMIVIAISHTCFVLKTFKSQPRPKHNQPEIIAPHLLTRSQKIIKKYKSAGNDGT
jgi:hypothetical protein